MDDCLQRQIAKKSLNWKSKLVLSTLVTTWPSYIHCISFATDLAANFDCYRFGILPDIVSKLLRNATWRNCAVQFESEQTLFFCTGCQFRSAALQCLHRILFGTCCFVPMLYFYSETNEWSKDGANQWALIPLKIHLAWKKTDSLLQKFTYHLNLVDLNWVSITKVSIARVMACFPQVSS